MKRYATAPNPDTPVGPVGPSSADVSVTPMTPHLPRANSIGGATATPKPVPAWIKKLREDWNNEISELPEGICPFAVACCMLLVPLPKCLIDFLASRKEAIFQRFVARRRRRLVLHLARAILTERYFFAVSS